METLEDKLRRPASLGGYKGSMTTDDIRKAIRKFGKYKTKEGRISIYSVLCSVCGKEILNNDPEEVMLDTGASVTKRGTAVFWHLKCQKKFWKSKIH